MSKVEYEELNRKMEGGTQGCFKCSSLDVELIGEHDYDYETKVGVRFFVDLHCRKCGFGIRVREQIIDRWGILLLQTDSDKALQYVDLVHIQGE